MASRKYCLNKEILVRKIAIYKKFREHVISQKFGRFLISRASLFSKIAKFAKFKTRDLDFQGIAFNMKYILLVSVLTSMQ